jgi:anti-sigma regulatory factor (Ser/Thr protein kinase)
MTDSEPRVAGQLKADSTAPTTARHLAVHTLKRWGLTRLADSAQLIVSELATNALSHGQGDTMTVAVSRLPAHVRIAVTDHGGGIPLPRLPRDDEESGRGLLIVGALSDAWGMTARGGDKTVWADVPIDNPV